MCKTVNIWNECYIVRDKDEKNMSFTNVDQNFEFNVPKNSPLLDFLRLLDKYLLIPAGYDNAETALSLKEKFNFAMNR